jgi:protein-arginine kinase activator protein McsA
VFRYKYLFGVFIMRYTDEQLLQSLRDFFAEHNVVPKHNQLIVSKECFRHRFGSLSDALVKAGLTPTKQAIQPKTCERCSTSFTPQKKVQRFCSHSCAATVLNATRQRAHNPE